MISAEIVMYGFGMLLILGAIYLIVILTIRKSIWNYPPIASMYIFLTVLFLFFSILIIEQIEITSTINILVLATIIIWGFITFHLPARKEEITETNKGDDVL